MTTSSAATSATAPGQVRRRFVPVPLLAVVALLAALLGTTVTGEHSAHAATSPTTHVRAERALTARQAAFHDQMRELWEDHVTWTRLAIVAFADGSGGFPANAARLLRNQQDIGDAFKPYYGEAAGDRLAALLHDHITIAVEILRAAKAGDQPAVNDAVTRWYANADEIADFLASANPRFWPQSTMRSMMKTHLDQTLAEAQDELAGDYAASVNEYDAIHAHILAMADMLSSGIMRAFPRALH